MIAPHTSWFDTLDLASAEIFIPLASTVTQTLSIFVTCSKINTLDAYFSTMFARNGRDEPEWLWRWGAASGRGLTDAAARRGALAEAIERASLIGGDAADPRLIALGPNTGAPVDRCALLQLSMTQKHALRSRKNYISSFGCGKHVDNRWIKGVALQDGALVGLPASAVLFGEDVRLGLTGWDAPLSTSNGTAVRERFEEARTHALLERMERDAVAIWWYNRLPAGALHATSVAAALPDALGEFLAGRSRVTKHLLMPSDLPAPVVVAVSARADGTGLAIGAGAGLSAERALTSATLEMLECEVTLSHMRALQRRPNAPPVPSLLAWSDAAALAEPHLAGTAQAAMPPTITEAELVAALAAKGIRVYVADISRPEFPVAVARVVSPDLREWAPRFAPGRLFDVPVALGLLPAPLAEDALNPVPFPI